MPMREPNQHRSKDEVLELIRECQQSTSTEAQTKLVTYYQPLVRSLTKKFSNRFENDDLVQVGMVGLLSAINRFDITIGKSFESYAVPTIVGEIKRYIRDKTWSVHVPRRVKELGPKIKQVVEKLTNDLERSPKVEEIAAELKVTEEEVLETMEMGQSYQALSVDRSLEVDNEGGEVTLLDLVGIPDEGYQKTDRQIILEKAFVVLTEREREIIKHTYFDNLSQKETGDKLGISQMHVSRLQRKALVKLRESLKLEPSECL